MLNLPFKPEDKILEIGGGESPWFRPNLDVRPLPTVDVVHDFREPLPFADGEWDGIFSKFALEHVTLNQLKAHLKDVYRCLAPGGYFVAVTANLLEQAKYILSHRFDKDSCFMVFAGSPDYEFNYHQAGFSPAWIGELMQEAGFSTIVVSPWIHAVSDMIVEARR